MEGQSAKKAEYNKLGIEQAWKNTGDLRLFRFEAITGNYCKVPEKKKISSIVI